MEGSKKYNQILSNFPSVCQSPKAKLLFSCYLPLERQASDSKTPDIWGINCPCLLSVGRHIPNCHPNSPNRQFFLCMPGCHPWKTQKNRWQ